MMIVSNLGQQRPARDPFRDGVTEAALDTTWAEIKTGGGPYLYTAETIATKIANHYESGLNLGRDGAIRMADGEIRPDQKFYLVEFEQAGEILAARSPLTETAQNWYELMKIYMRHRIVSIPFCSYGEEADPVTRQCVTEPAEIQPELDLEPERKAITSSLILPLSIAAVGLVILLGGGK